MTISYFSNRLAPLASEKYQAMYGLLGTKDNYLRPDEMLEMAHECVEKVRTDHTIATTLSPSTQAKILHLETFLMEERKLDLANKSWSELINHPAWQQIRSQAATCLLALQFNLVEWETNNV